MANILLLGDPGVGKTTWIKRIVGETFSESYMTTLCKTMKEVKIVDRKIFVHDMSGNERFQEVNVYYEIADGALIFYDVSKHNGLERVNYWKKKLNKTIPFLLVGNKSDLIQDRINFISCKEDDDVRQPLIDLLKRVPHVECPDKPTILDWVWDLVYYYLSLYSSE